MPAAARSKLCSSVSAWLGVLASVMFWPVDPAKNAIQGDAPEGTDTF